MKRTRPTVEERFWSKVQKTDTCWLWTAYKTEQGYASFSVYGKSVVAHRFSYELKVGPIPSGLSVDHLCRVRHCVRPSHLEPVTCKENILRGVGLAAINAKRTYCHRGHEFNIENSHKDKRGSRICRKCKALDHRKRYLANRSKIRAATLKYYYENFQKCSAMRKAWRLANLEKRLAQAKEYYLANRSRILTAQKEKRRAMSELKNLA